MVKIGFTDNEIQELIYLAKKYSKNKKYQSAKEKLLTEKNTYEETIEILTQIAENKEEVKQQLYLLFILEHIGSIYDKYKTLNIPEDIIYDTISDIRVKVDECINIKKVLGIIWPEWFALLYKAEIVKLGRFQYAFEKFKHGYYEKNDVILSQCMPAVHVHIPRSSEKMDDETRSKSYKMAYQFFKERYPEMLQNGFLPVLCETWLFFEKHKDFLDKNSSILRFMSEFDIISKTEWDVFLDGEFLFGLSCIENKNFDKYPQETTLEKAYVKWMSTGNKTGTACGIKLLKY